MIQLLGHRRFYWYPKNYMIPAYYASAATPLPSGSSTSVLILMVIYVMVTLFISPNLRTRIFHLGTYNGRSDPFFVFAIISLASHFCTLLDAFLISNASSKLISVLLTDNPKLDQKTASVLCWLYCWARAVYLCHGVFTELENMPGKLRTMNILHEYNSSFVLPWVELILPHELQTPKFLWMLISMMDIAISAYLTVEEYFLKDPDVRKRVQRMALCGQILMNMFAALQTMKAYQLKDDPNPLTITWGQTFNMCSIVIIAKLLLRSYADNHEVASLRSKREQEILEHLVVEPLGG